ncbi:TPA: DUF551 domain-containing protein [Klebsiella pneumoniae]
MALAAMDSEPDCKERKLFCSTDTARMRKVISVSAGTGDAPLYRHAQPVADSEQDRNPVLGYADSYRDMAKQSVESVPIWSVITDLERNIAPLYRHAQPAPVVPEEVTDEDCPALVKYDVTEVDEAWARGFNACRSAMLQELKKSAGTEATCRSNENAQVLTSINPAPDLVSLPKNAKSLTGNSPVIPDGSASMLRRWLAFGRGMQNVGSQLPHNLIAETESMLAAAPQSPSSEPATVPGKWIPVSERMPDREVDVQVYCPDKKEQMVAYLERNELEGYFRFATWRTGDGIYCQPTHWMRLPAGPREVKGE